jgi:mevalonate pyrophosphate decarboxylase
MMEATIRARLQLSREVQSRSKNCLALAFGLARTRSGVACVSQASCSLNYSI